MADFIARSVHQPGRVFQKFESKKYGLFLHALYVITSGIFNWFFTLFDIFVRLYAVCMVFLWYV